MFKSVSSRVSLPEMEEGVLQFWKEEDIFRRTESEREGGPRFMLYEGPAHGQRYAGYPPCAWRGCSRTSFCRYKTMKGIPVPAEGGLGYARAAGGIGGGAGAWPHHQAGD